MSIEIRVLGPDDVGVLADVAPDVFDHAVDPRFAAEFLKDTRHHLAVALDAGTVVGMASALHYVHPDKPPELWVNEVGVAPAYRRKGIARRLLSALFDLGVEMGCRTAWVGTEEGNEAARRLYEDAGGRAEAFVMYSFDVTGRRKRPRFGMVRRLC